MKLNRRISSIVAACMLAITISSCSAAAGNVAVSAAEDVSISADMFTERDLEQTADTDKAASLELADGGSLLVDEEGVYVLSGNVSDSIVIVDAGDEAKVQLVLNELSIENESLPAIYIKSADKVFITTESGDSSLSVSGTYENDGDANLDAVIFSRSDLVLNGTGSLEIYSANGNGISSKDDLKITGGALNVYAADDGLEANDSIRIYDGEISIEAGEDALHSENDADSLSGYIYIQGGSLDISAGDDGIRGTSVIQIDGGTVNINTCQEGIEATQIQINDGTIDIYATDDGINATAKSSLEVKIEVYGGDISVEMASGDTDAFDSNGDLYIYGGNIDVTTPKSSFDANGTAQLISGNVTVNGTAVTELAQGRTGQRKHR